MGGVVLGQPGRPGRLITDDSSQTCRPEGGRDRWKWLCLLLVLLTAVRAVLRARRHGLTDQQWPECD